MFKISIAFIVGIFSIFSQFYSQIVDLVFPLIGFALAVFAINKAKNLIILILGIMAMITCIFAVILELYCMRSSCGDLMK